MSADAGIAAIVLAAGRSSRMGTSKALLPLGSGSVIERVVRSVLQAGVGDILVVTGHGAEHLAPVLDGLRAREVHNPDWEVGMFSSVQAGVRTLSDGVEAFFVLPVDCPLVGPKVLERLLQSFHEGERGILYPSCCGRRGHPPLISGRYRDALLQANKGDNLRSFLERHPGDVLDVQVEDITVLMDMDTAEDHRRMSLFADIIDGVERASEAGDASLTPAEALYLLSLLEVPDHVIRHCRTVAVVGQALAEALKCRLPDFDVDLVRSACLLHDMARGERRHAAIGQSILSSLGLCRLGSIVGSHMFMPPEMLEAPLVSEDELVYLADKLVIEGEVGSFEERSARALRQGAGDPAALDGVRTRMRTAQIIREKVETILERPLAEVLGQATGPLGS